MPLLAKEIDIQPETLFELPADQHPWWVAHVRARQEKVLARHLARHGVPFYLPLTERRTRRAGRTLISYLPLFSGYLFFRGGHGDVVWRSNTAAAVIEVPDQEQFGSELAQIRALQLAGASLRLEETLAAGDPVRITEGPFRGYQGIVLDERRRDRMLVRLSLLKRFVAVELDRETLRRERVATASGA